jgi:hypothetical protein
MLRETFAILLLISNADLAYSQGPLLPIPDPISDPNANLSSPIVALPLIGTAVASQDCTDCPAVEAVPTEDGELAFSASTNEGSVDVLSFDGVTYAVRVNVPGNDGNPGYFDWQVDTFAESTVLMGNSANVDPGKAEAYFGKKGGTPGGNKGTKGSCGAFGQAQLYVLLTDGTEYWPTNYEDLVNILNQVAAQGKTVSSLIIKGHGSGDGVQVGLGAMLVCVDGQVVIVPDGENEIDITTVLQNVTNGSSVISLRACFSAEVAACAQSAIGNGVDVRGAVRFVIGIPGTTVGFGVYE